MRIGFVKLGLKTYFEKSGSGQGANHELVDVFNIFQERGHECFMVSGSDKYEQLKDISNLDYLFVFNGPITKYNLEGTQMFKNYTKPYVDMINTGIKWVYFWTDPRKEYDVRDNPNIVNKPTVILSQETECYGGLEKLICYNHPRVVAINNYKENRFAVLMNETEPKRSKKVQSTLDWLGFGEIKGAWKNKTKWNTGPLKEEEVSGFLSKLRFSYNIAANHKWVSQKYYEMLLNNVVCFYSDYDSDNLLLCKDHFLRVKDEIDLEEKIGLLENDPVMYNKLMTELKAELKEEYYNGDYIYNLINKKLNQCFQE